MARRPLVALVPLPPVASGNGLAMRAASVTSAAQRDFDVSVVVVPVVAPAPVGDRHGGVAAVLGELGIGDRARVSAGISSLLADATWRDRLAAVAPLPGLARAASPGHVDELARMVGAAIPDGGAGVPVHAMRAYLAPLGLALAERLGSAWVTLDLDDDDEALALTLGAREEADAYHRLLGVFAPHFSRVVTAAATDAAEVGRRHGLDVGVVPNAVAVPPYLRRAPEVPPALLFVGTLDYRPNTEAALSLAEDVLPAVRSRGPRDASAWIAGSFDPHGPLARLAGREGVTVHGFVEDLAPLYARASAVVAPLFWGSGTRIKILEAFAHGVPVVTTPAGAAGLDVAPGEHLLVADTPQGLAEEVLRLLGTPGLGERLAASGRRYAATAHSQAAVERAVGAMFSDASARGRSAGPPATP